MNEYILCHPDDGEPLLAARNVYLRRVPYFTVPSCVVKEHTFNWSLAKLTGSELRLYISVLSLANCHHNNEFKTTASELRKLSGLAPATLKKALDALEERGLVYVTGLKDYTVNLCDPYTGEPLHEQTGVDEDDPANDYVTGGDGRTKRLNLNTGDAERVEKLIRSCLPEDEVPTVQGNGDLMMRCPFHTDSNPSCSVSPSKNSCFHCFGCDKSGSLAELIGQLNDMTKGETIQRIATAFGTKAEYHRPDARVIAKYSYRPRRQTQAAETGTSLSR